MRVMCPKCDHAIRMWHDGERWSCGCGWRGDADEYLIADAMARATIGPLEEWEDVDGIDWAFERMLEKLGPLTPTSVVLMKTKEGKWTAHTVVNTCGGTCSCLMDKNFDSYNVVEVRLVNLMVED